ncbi:MAG: T9SS C-terminal target domain-containing protein [Bacteroidetes bacterium]|nr:MAG: T9SS C-terminal target domain-containing protein [Bacteroidota bacterium]
MARFLLFLCPMCLLLSTTFFPLMAQPSEQQTRRLFFLCKVWGYYKYFHPGLAVCQGPDWDFALTEAIESIRRVPSQQAFELALERMQQYLPPLEQPSSPPPNLNNRLTYKLQLDWMEDEFLPRQLRTQLLQLREAFRRQPHCNVETGPDGRSLLFAREAPFPAMVYPNEAYRLLALFRFWNAVEYFYPYTHLLSTNWDESLMQMIPAMIAAPDSRAYHIEVARMLKRIQDGNAYLISPEFNQLIGMYYAPFELDFVENQSVICRVAGFETQLKPGDVVLRINGMPIQQLRDSLRSFAWGGHAAGTDELINDWLIRGPEGAFEIEVKNESGTHTYQKRRELDAFGFEKALPDEGAYFKRLPGNFAYIDLKRLNPSRTNNVLSTLLRGKSTPTALILDLRHTSLNFFQEFAAQFVPQSTTFALAAYPDPQFPGTLSLELEQQTGFSGVLYDIALFLIIDESTRGGGEFTAMSLEPYEKLLKIGSPTAGSVGAHLSSLRLPGGINVLFNTQLTRRPEGEEVHLTGIEPDLLVQPTIQSITQGKDALLDAAIAQAKPSTGRVSVVPFPNPCTGFLNVLVTPATASHISVEILDYTGRQLRSYELQNDRAIFRLDLSDLQSGYYLVKSTEDGQVAVHKFHKQ